MSIDHLLTKYKKLSRSDPSNIQDHAALKRQKLSEHENIINNVPESSLSSMRASNQQNRVISVIFQGHEGFSNSVTHYYHFLFGAMIPLIEYHVRNKGIAGYKIKTDVGPMKHILCELPLNIVEIVGPDATLTRVDATKADVALPAYDIFVDDIYGDQSIPTLSKDTISTVCRFMDDNMPTYIRAYIPTFDIILIERTNSESYYRNLETEVRNVPSGSMLRSIRNHTAIAEALAGEFQNRFCNLKLERSSIFYQYHIFSHAKIVIAQHGAALSNIIFMKPSPNAAVIEIRPPATTVLPHFRARARTHFINLAKHVGLIYIEVNQADDHADVNIDDILGHVRALDAMS